MMHMLERAEHVGHRDIYQILRGTACFTHDVHLWVIEEYVSVNSVRRDIRGPYKRTSALFDRVLDMEFIYVVYEIGF